MRLPLFLQFVVKHLSDLFPSLTVSLSFLVYLIRVCLPVIFSCVYILRYPLKLFTAQACVAKSLKCERARYRWYAILLFYPRNQSERETVNICTIRINDTRTSERWKSKTKIEVAANVLGFPLLRKVDVTWLEGERRKMRDMEPKKYDVVWAFESHNFQSFERGVTK